MKTVSRADSEIADATAYAYNCFANVGEEYELSP